MQYNIYIKKTTMTNKSSILEMLSYNLGVDSKVRNKASELNELLEVRAASSISALRLTGSCRLVICLDLAAKIYGCSLNQAEVVRLSSMTKKNYYESAKVIARLLNLEEHVTLRELALQFGCPSLVTLATDILHRYSSQQCSDMEFHSAMFMCAALVVSARQQKVTIHVGKLRERSGIKKTTFDKLVTEMEKYSSKISDENQSSHNKKRTLLDDVEDLFQDDQCVAKIAKKENSNTEHTQKLVSPSDYEEWKKKILAKSRESS